MPWFEYEGLTPGGASITGRIEAGDHGKATESLAAMRIEVCELTAGSPPVSRRASLSDADFIFFNEQLASLAKAGIALDEGLAQLARDVNTPRLRRWIMELAADVKQGTSLDQALAARERGLPVLYSQVVRAGIEAGDLPGTLLNLNQHLRLAGNTRRMVWELASYPVLVLLMALALVSLVFTLVVPHLKEVFTDFGATLPALTVMILNFADWFRFGVPPGWAIVWLTPVAVVLLWGALRLWEGGRHVREQILLRLPVIGRIYQASLIARFLRAVATAVGTHIPLPQALRLSAGATGSRLLGTDAEHLASEVEQGHSIFAANQSTRLIPPLFGFCVQVAAGREALPAAIGQLAHAYENRALHTQSMMRVVLFPVSIIAVGMVLGLIVLGMFLPMVSLVNAVSGGW